MPLGEYKQPQAGPKIGKQASIDELPAHKQAAIGDFAAQMAAPPEDPAPAPIEPPPIAQEDEERIQRGIATMEALQRVHEQEEAQEPAVDPIEEAAEPTEEDKQEFIRCMLGNRRYSKTFELLGGSVKVTLGDLTPKQEEDLYLELSRAQPTVGDEWAVTLDRLRLLAYGGGKGFGMDAFEDSVPATYEGTTALVENLPSAAHYSVLMHISRVFRRHLEIMMERALDSDFWKVDGSSSPPAPLPEDPSTTAENLDSVVGS